MEKSPRLGLISDAALDQSKNIWVINGTYNAENWLGSAVTDIANKQWSEALMPKIEHPILSAVSAYSPEDVWAVGYKWSDYPSDFNHSQRGARSLVMHWDGEGWSEVRGPDPSYIQQLFDVAVVDNGDVWAVGTSSDNEDNPGSGLVAHFVKCSDLKDNPASTMP